jgi:hypothetical protein
VARVSRWADLSQARFAHPRREHLLPVMVTLGAGADDIAVRDFRDTTMGEVVSGYRFGGSGLSTRQFGADRRRNIDAENPETGDVGVFNRYAAQFDVA